MKTNNYFYCGVRATERAGVSSNNKNYNPLGSDRQYESLGDKIFRMIQTGEDVGEKITPQFDGNEVDDLDVTKSFKHDAMDIAEEFGRLPDSSPAPLVEGDGDNDCDVDGNVE